MQKIKDMLQSPAFHKLIKGLLGYVGVCVVFELIKQYFVFKHQKYLVKTNSERADKLYKIRQELRESLEEAVVTGNHREIERLRK